MKRIAALALSWTALGFGHASAQASGDCPNTRASEVEAYTDSEGGERCGLGLSLFGWDVGLFGPKCPDRKIFYPAHQVCAGARNPGTRCVPEGEVDATVQDCECDVAGVFGTGVALPSCDCSATTIDGGKVEDFRTDRCEDGRVRGTRDPKVQA